MSPITCRDYKISAQSGRQRRTTQPATMASSSVSQEDVENDFEKLEKRSRIRTARARQINPQVWFSSTMCSLVTHARVLYMRVGHWVMGGAS